MTAVSSASNRRLGMESLIDHMVFAVPGERKSLLLMVEEVGKADICS